MVTVVNKLNSQRRTYCSYRSATSDVFPRFLRKLAQRKHFPAINWNISFSKYIRSWAFKVALHLLIRQFQAAEKEYFPVFWIAHLLLEIANSVCTKQPHHCCKVFWSHTSRSMTQSTATWQLEETCDLSFLHAFFMSHD